MAQRLKDLYLTRESVGKLAAAIRIVSQNFEADRFLRDVFNPEWKNLELLGRMHHISRCLGKHLRLPYDQALRVLEKAAPSVQGWEVMVFPDFVEMFGQDDPDRSIPALGFFTRFGSAEFAIRPFLICHPARAMAAMHRWALDPEPKVRRLASEGSRPKLPWAIALPAFKVDPTPVLEILEKLKDDPSEDVRRSVANNLNDISKDHPGVLLDVCRRWMGNSPRTDALLKHACRGLLKKGNREALRRFGFVLRGSAKVEGLLLAKKRVSIGGRLAFGFTLVVGGKERRKIRLEYAIDYAKNSGKTSRKVFHLSEKRHTPGRVPIRREHAFKNLTTRRHYPGQHRITIIVNGRDAASSTFVLSASRRD